MIASPTEQQLRQLREGAHLRYRGVLWRVTDYSTYTDINGYETEEWLLKSSSGREYYLMRELDPQNPTGLVHWYIAEAVLTPLLYETSTAREVTYTVADAMRSHQMPYPELQMFNRTYQFESQTEGEYDTDGSYRTRITWDYWDAPHLWNLALEAWSNGEFAVYSTRQVQPADFSDLQPGTPRLFGSRLMSAATQAETADTLRGTKRGRTTADRSLQLVMAWAVTIIGFFLMISGI